MGVLLERKTQVIFITASSVEQNGKAREVIVESRPQYAVVQLNGWVYVADRENHRVQVFDGNGRFETAWNNVVHRPSALHMTSGPCPLCFIGELGPYLGSNRGFPNLGPRISILSNTGKLLARLGSEVNPHGQAPGQFMSPHGIAVDSRGDIYVGEVSVASWPSLFPNHPRPDRLRSLQKLVKVT